VAAVVVRRLHVRSARPPATFRLPVTRTQRSCGSPTLDLPVVQRVLANQPVESGSSRSWPNIEHWLRIYNEQAERGETVVVDGRPGARPPDQPALMTYGDTRVMREGCHRTSALWLCTAQDFELRLIEAPADWPGYENSQIRERGRPFPGAPAVTARFH
jgi:hypothetical protein